MIKLKTRNNTFLELEEYGIYESGNIIFTCEPYEDEFVFNGYALINTETFELLFYDAIDTVKYLGNDKKWIDINEKLPSENEKVLIKYIDTIYIVTYKNGNWIYGNNKLFNPKENIKLWQPLEKNIKENKLKKDIEKLHPLQTNAPEPYIGDSSNKK